MEIDVSNRGDAYIARIAASRRDRVERIGAVKPIDVDIVELDVPASRKAYVTAAKAACGTGVLAKRIDIAKSDIATGCQRHIACIALANGPNVPRTRGIEIDATAGLHGDNAAACVDHAARAGCKSTDTAGRRDGDIAAGTDIRQSEVFGGDADGSSGACAFLVIDGPIATFHHITGAADVDGRPVGLQVIGQMGFMRGRDGDDAPGRPAGEGLIPGAQGSDLTDIADGAARTIGDQRDVSAGSAGTRSNAVAFGIDACKTQAAVVAGEADGATVLTRQISVAVHRRRDLSKGNIAGGMQRDVANGTSVVRAAVAGVDAGRVATIGEIDRAIGRHDIDRTALALKRDVGAVGKDNVLVGLKREVSHAAHATPQRQAGVGRGCDRHSTAGVDTAAGDATRATDRQAAAAAHVGADKTDKVDGVAQRNAAAVIAEKVQIRCIGAGPAPDLSAQLPDAAGVGRNHGQTIAANASRRCPAGAPACCSAGYVQEGIAIEIDPFSRA